MSRRGEEIPAGESGPGDICCGGGGSGDAPAAAAGADVRTAARYLGTGLLGLTAWWLVYRALSPFAKWVTFSLLSLPPGRPLSLHLDHPRLARVTFAVSFVPDECPVWANARTVSVEPYLHLALPPGETRHWWVEHGFAA